MRRQEIEELIRLVEESQITELEICEGKRKIRISKSASAASSVSSSDGVTASQPGAPAEEPSNPAKPLELAPNLKQIVSPMVGTFYRAPAPDADPFTDVGRAVAAGQTVCVVEAMKLMNEIGSDFSGTIRSVLVDNGQPVEFGQPLFLVEAA